MSKNNATKKESVFEDKEVENIKVEETTSTNGFKDSKTPDRVLDAKALQDKVSITKAKRVPFKCEIAYSAYYPNGFESTYQGIQIGLIFDGRTVELPEAVIQFVKAKIERKVMSEMEKRKRNSNPQGAQTNLGNFIV